MDAIFTKPGHFKNFLLNPDDPCDQEKSDPFDSDDPIWFQPCCRPVAIYISMQLLQGETIKD